MENKLTASFDEIAVDYDKTFSDTVIGRIQRSLVWDFIKKKMPSKPAGKVLEINCGTGVDANWFFEQGYNVTATDISQRMIDVAIKKSANTPILFVCSSFLDLPERLVPYEEFTLVFSNFGGLNCQNALELEKLSEIFSDLTESKGKLYFVIMGSVCLWEILYFSCKLNFRKAFRRLSSKGSIVDLGNGPFTTWYYSPHEIEKMFCKNFKMVKKQPIGLFVPPSYLESFFSKRKKTIHFLDFMERKFGQFSFLSNFADHYIIELEKKS